MDYEIKFLALLSLPLRLTDHVNFMWYLLQLSGLWDLWGFCHAWAVTLGATAVWFDTSVCSFMSLQMFKLAKFLVTLGAAKGFITCVCSFMSSQIS